MTTYGDVVLGMGPSSYWPLTSNGADSAGANTLTANSTATFGGGAPLVAGDTASTSLGATGYLTGGDIFDFTGNVAQSVVMWVQIPATVTAVAVVMSKYDGVLDAGWEMLINLSGAGGRLLSTGNYPGPTVANATTGVVSAAPTMIGRSYDGTTLKNWINGTQTAGTASSATTADSTASFTVGARATGTGSFSIANSLVSHVAIWNRELTASERFTLWWTGKQYSDAPPHRMPFA